MRSKTKIVVLHMKELIYTGIFLLLGILFLILIILMFFPGTDSDKAGDAVTTAYVPGVYTTSLMLGQSSIEMEIVLDENNINSIRLINLSETITTMYPLIEPAFDDLVGQIYDGCPLSAITYPDDNRYTSSVLLGAIETTLAKAAVSKPEASGEESGETTNTKASQTDVPETETPEEENRDSDESKPPSALQ